MKVPFCVDNLLPIVHGHLPVQGGIPIPRGTLPRDAPLRVLDDDGVEIPAQINRTATWPEGSLKFVLVMFHTAVAADSMKRFMLEASPVTVHAGRKLEVSETSERITVWTGRMEFTVPRKRAGVIESLSMLRDGRRIPVVTPDNATRLFMDVVRGTPDSGDRIRFRTDYDREHFSAQVEEANAHRAVICLKGVHASAGGETFAPYTVRLYAYADTAQIRIAHFVYFDADPQQTFIRAIGLDLHADAARINGYAFSQHSGPGFETVHSFDPKLPHWSTGMLSQTQSRAYVMKKWIDPNRNAPVRICEGDRAQGWARIRTDSATVTMGVKNFWQEYPKALAVNSPERLLTAYLYSPEGDILDLRRYSDLGYGQLYESTLEPENWPVPFNHPRDGARYVGKSSELFIAVDAADVDLAESSRASLFFQTPPILSAGAEWMGRTRVFGPVGDAEKLADHPGTTRLRKCIDFIDHEIERCGWYGFVDYGDVMHSYDVERDCWRFDQGGFAWNNNECQLCESLWYTYLATGDPRAFRMAEAMTRHVNDVDMYHAGNVVGRATRHNVSHWGCPNKERRKTIPENKRIYYFLTGDEHTRDLIHLIYDALCKTGGEGGAMDLGVGATALMFLWETTGDPHYGELLKKICEGYCSQRIEGRGFVHRVNVDWTTGDTSFPDTIESLEGFFLLEFGPAQILTYAAELTQSSVVRKALLDWAEILHMEAAERGRYTRRIAVGAWGYVQSMRVAVYAWEQTGDDRYRMYIAKGLTTPLFRFEWVGCHSPFHRAEHQIIEFNYDIPRELWNTYDKASVDYLRPAGNIYLNGEIGHMVFIGRTMMSYPFGLSAV